MYIGIHGKWRILNVSKSDTITDDMKEGRRKYKKRRRLLPMLTSKRTNKMEKRK